MKVCFRFDASILIGTGHVMRCLTLADALNSKGMECHFICREHPGNMIIQIAERGHKVHSIPINKLENVADFDKNEKSHSPYSHWLGENLQTDARQTSFILEELKPDWLIVDHYALDAQWESAISNLSTKVMVIDDLTDRPHDCDLLLDQTFGRTENVYKSLVPQHCTILTGSKYALLRPEFAELREYSLQRRKDIRFERILITMGGVDKDNATGQILGALTQCQLPNDVRITVVMGQNSPWLDSVKDLSMELPWTIEILVSVSNMAQLMADSDLCIGAAGSTAWERCCLGLPTLMVVLADNQKDAADFLEKSQSVFMLFLEVKFNEQLSSKIQQINKMPNIISSMAEQASKVTDGRGCDRVVEKILDIR